MGFSDARSEWRTRMLGVPADAYGIDFATVLVERARRGGRAGPGRRVGWAAIEAIVADGASGRNSGFAIDLPHTSGGSEDENKDALEPMRLSRARASRLGALAVAGRSVTARRQLRRINRRFGWHRPPNR